MGRHRCADRPRGCRETEHCRQPLCLLDAFGTLFAHTDRHHGNVSLLLHQHRWQLAPAYDMLPMFYAPVAGEVVERDWASQVPRPNGRCVQAL